MAWCWPPPPCPGAHTALLELLRTSPDAEELDFGELFAGQGAVSSSLAALGYRGRALDRERCPDMDMLRPLGMAIALRVALSIRPGGCMWLAPPCSSWVWLTRGSSGRNVTVEGDVTLASIVAQNAIAERVALILAVLTGRGVYWIVEQPASSVLWDYPAMRRCLTEHGLKHPTVMDMGAFGGSSVKPTHLWGTAPYLGELARTCSAPERLQLRLAGVQTTLRSTDAQGRRRCQGTADLKGTQAYPWGFGAAHALAFSAHYGPPAAAGAPSSPPEHLREMQQHLGRLTDAWWLRDFCGEPFGS